MGRRKKAIFIATYSIPESGVPLNHFLIISPKIWRPVKMAIQSISAVFVVCRGWCLWYASHGADGSQRSSLLKGGEWESCAAYNATLEGI